MEVNWWKDRKFYVVWSEIIVIHYGNTFQPVEPIRNKVFDNAYLSHWPYLFKVFWLIDFGSCTKWLFGIYELHSPELTGYQFASIYQILPTNMGSERILFLAHFFRCAWSSDDNGGDPWWDLRPWDPQVSQTFPTCQCGFGVLSSL